MNAEKVLVPSSFVNISPYNTTDGHASVCQASELALTANAVIASPLSPPPPSQQHRLSTNVLVLVSNVLVQQSFAVEIVPHPSTSYTRTPDAANTTDETAASMMLWWKGGKPKSKHDWPAKDNRTPEEPDFQQALDEHREYVLYPQKTLLQPSGHVVKKQKKVKFRDLHDLALRQPVVDPDLFQPYGLFQPLKAHDW